MKRLVANLDNIPSEEHSQTIAYLKKEYRILSRFGKQRGVVEVFDLIEERNKRNHKTLTLYERNYRLGGLEDPKIYSDDQKWKIAGDFLKGLQFIHKHKILHRDLKLANLVVDTPDMNFSAKSPVEAAIADFNIASEIESEEAPLGIAGTPCFVSPEKARVWRDLIGDWTVKAERMSELWSAGIVLHELFIGEIGKSLRELTSFKTQSDFPFKPKPKNALENFIYQFLQVDPTKRITIDKAVEEFERIRPKETFWSSFRARPQPQNTTFNLEGKESEGVTPFMIKTRLYNDHF